MVDMEWPLTACHSGAGLTADSEKSETLRCIKDARGTPNSSSSMHAIICTSVSQESNHQHIAVSDMRSYVFRSAGSRDDTLRKFAACTCNV